eukprot:m.172014 g.172014  ORF g.172014 m.172014 type:complete len:304 (-) comp17850_c0_seq1:42-953(-)
MLATCTSSGGVNFYTSEGPDQPYTFAGEYLGHTRSVRGLALYDSNRSLFTGSFDRTAKVVDVETRQATVTCRGHVGDINAVAVSQDLLLGTVSDDRYAKFWDRRTGKCVRQLPNCHEKIVRDLAFSDDGLQLLTCSHDGLAKLWDLGTEKAVTSFQHDNAVFKTCFVPHSSLVVCAGSKMCKVWDVNTGTEQQTLLSHGENALVFGLDCHPDGRHVATGSDNLLCVWDLLDEDEDKLPIATFDNHTDTVWCVAFGEDRLAAASGDGSVSIWDLTTNTKTESLQHRERCVYGCSFGVADCLPPK